MNGRRAIATNELSKTYNLKNVPYSLAAAGHSEMDGGGIVFSKGKLLIGGLEAYRIGPVEIAEARMRQAAFFQEQSQGLTV